MRTRSILTTLALTQTLAAAAREPGWSVCTTELEITPISEPSVEGRTIIGRDERGVEVRLPIRSVYMLRAPRAPAPLDQSSPGDDTMLLELTDAQRLPVVVLTGDDPDAVLVRSLVHDDERAFSLDELRALGRDGSDNPPPTIDDRVTLTNGDVIEGFVVGIGERVSIETGSGIRDLDLSQIERIEIVNDASPRPGVQALVGDGVRVAAESLSVSASGPVLVTLERVDPGDPLTLLPDQFGGLDVIHAASTLVPLAELTPETSVTGAHRVWTPPPRTGDERLYASALSDIEIPAPARLEYELPAGADRFAAGVELLAGRWSGCELVVSAGPPGAVRELTRVRLDQRDHTAEINTPLPRGAATLVIEVDPGVNGALQDHIVLRAPRLRVQRSAQFE